MKKIKLVGRRRTGVSEETGKRYDFISFSSQAKDGTWYDVKFTSNCGNIPKTSGVFEMYTDLKNLSINGSTKTLWVKEFSKIVDITDDIRTDELATINGMWGDDDED